MGPAWGAGNTAAAMACLRLLELADTPALVPASAARRRSSWSRCSPLAGCASGTHANSPECNCDLRLPAVQRGHRHVDNLLVLAFLPYPPVRQDPSARHEGCVALHTTSTTTTTPYPSTIHL